MFEYSHLGKEIGQLLRKLREKVRLSQTEVAKRIGISPKTGHGFISRLESGQVKSPPLYVIIFYISACGQSWPEFFKELDRIEFKMRHEEMISLLPPEVTQRKIQRDAMRYEIGVEFPSKAKEEIDFARLKKIIKDKVTVLVNKEEATLSSVLSPNRVPPESGLLTHEGSIRRPEEGRFDHQGRGGEAVRTAYQKFALEYFDFFASLNKAGMRMTADKYLRAGLQYNLISKIRKIITSVVGGEIKRIEAKKPLPTEKQEKMAIGFTQYRIRIEKIEAEAHRLLCDLGVPTSWFSLYKDFVRECYRVYKQYYPKMFAEPVKKASGETLEMTLNKLIEKWVKRGLKEDILMKLKTRILGVFTSMRMKGLA
jgi:transcriptional regulator with XRE-family HTH domain